MEWFSTKVRLVCLVEDTGALHYMDSVYIFRAEDFSTAFQRALELGRNQEEEYVNTDDKRVIWKFKEVISLDIIRKETLDGAEVYSEPGNLSSDEIFAFDVEFHPEQSQPTQTI